MSYHSVDQDFLVLRCFADLTALTAIRALWHWKPEVQLQNPLRAPSPGRGFQATKPSTPRRNVAGAAATENPPATSTHRSTMAGDLIDAAILSSSKMPWGQGSVGLYNQGWVGSVLKVALFLGISKLNLDLEEDLLKHGLSQIVPFPQKFKQK